MTIQAAADEFGAALAGSRAQRMRRDSAARELSDLELAMDQVEVHNLGSTRGIPRDVRGTLRRLGRRLSVPPPQSVWEARTLARLHAALLTWQGQLLDGLAPQRRRFADRFD